MMISYRIDITGRATIRTPETEIDAVDETIHLSTQGQPKIVSDGPVACSIEVLSEEDPDRLDWMRSVDTQRASALEQLE